MYVIVVEGHVRRIQLALKKWEIHAFCFGKSEENTSFEQPKLGWREEIRKHLKEIVGDSFEEDNIWFGAKSSG